MKRTLFFCLLVSNSLFAQVNLNQGLVAYYPFTGNANDQSGNNNNPSFNNATLTSDRFGNPNSAYSFDGSGSYIQIPNSASLNLGNQISLCAWVKPEGYYSGTCHGNSILMKGDGDYLPGNYHLRFDDNGYTDGQNCVNPITDEAHENFYGVNTGVPAGGYNPFIQIGQWYSVVFTYDGVTAKLYVNCELVITNQITTSSFSNAYDLFLGRLNDPQYPYWLNGVLDEVRIYNRAINQDEVKAYGGCSTTTSTTASFTMADTVCVNTPVQITNTSTNATNYFWNFCVADVNAAPTGTNLGNVGGQMQMPVYTDYAFDNGNYYGFVTNNSPGGLLRLDFGNSLLNTPTVTSLGDLGGVIPDNTEGLQVVNNEGQWYVIIVGGDPIDGHPSKIVKIELGANIANNSPTAVDWGNIGNLSYPHDLYVFNDNGNWYGFTVNYNNSTITKFDFTSSFSNTPTAINLGNVGNLSGPTGLHAINDNGNWHLFVTNAFSSSLTRLDFGTSLLNVPSGQNLGNIGGVFHTCWDIYTMKFCGETVAFVINANQSYNDLIRLNFGGSLLNTPTATSLGNIGNCLFPHCLSKIFRVGADLYSFITNVNNNTLTRLRFAGCTNSDIPNSSAQNPPSVTYNSPGTYNINLSVDEGLPTQTSFCKQIVVQNCADTIINDYTPVRALDPCDNKITVDDATAFNVGDTVLLIQMKGAAIDSSNSNAFGTIKDYKNAGNYEFNYVKSKAGNIIELKNVLTRKYDLPDGKVQLIRVPYYQNVTFNPVLTCLPWDGEKGGVLAFNVANTITLKNDIDVSGRGFRGGLPLNSSIITCGMTDYYYDPASNNGAEKGEGINSLLSDSKNYGRGSPANGGGGGNAHNCGGGGGGNGGTGGQGGEQWEGCQPQPYGGIGGKKLANSSQLNKIFLGGGGGMGHGNDHGEFPAGSGGGIIIFSANTLNSNNYKIKADGTNGFPCPSEPACSDGMGGGGAGGSILMSVNTVGNATAIEANGGNGADQVTTNMYRHGTGGGGAGGSIAFEQSAISTQFTTSYNGGKNGVMPAHNNDAYGATPGDAGFVMAGFKIAVDTQLFKTNIDSVRIKDSLAACNSFNFHGISFVNRDSISTWQWDFGDGNTGTTKDTTHTYANTVGNYTIKMVATDLNGCKDSSITIVNTVAPPLVKANEDSALCPGGHMQLIVAGATNYSWSPATGLSNTTIANPVATPTSTIQYIVTGTSNNGCSANDTVNITVNAKPTIAKSGDTSICKNSSIQLFASGGVIYNWSPSSSLSNNSIANPIASPSGNTTYYVSVTDNNSCTNNDSIKVSIRPDPVFSINSDTAICVNRSAQLDASGGNSYSWLPSGSLNDPSIANPTASPQTTTNYSVQITDTVCNISATLSTTVQVSPLPNVNAGKDSALCPGGQMQLTVVGAANYSWSPSTGLSDPTIANPVATPTSTIQYIVTGISNSGCSANDTVNITVNIKPAIAKSNDTLICKNSSVQLFASGGVIYNWTPSSSLSNNSIANPIASPSGNTTYYVTVTDNNSCNNSDSIKVSVRPDPVFSINSATAICINGSVQLEASGGNVYSWLPAESLNNPFIANPTASPQNSTNYSVLITDTVCNNSTTLTTAVQVAPLPTVKASKSNDLDCTKDFSQLNATGAVKYSWSPAATLSNTNIANPVATPVSPTIYIVKGTDAQGCVNYDSVMVVITASNKSGYFMPNAFTPNNDGLNDCYGIKYWGVIQELDFGIYNRWGERIFHTHNPSDCWDGTYKGVQQNPDVYVYLIKAKTFCGDVFKKGTFVLIR